MIRLKLLVNFLFIFIFQLVYSQNDCTDALIICGNSNYTDLSATGAGIQEISPVNSCGSQENNSLWLKISIKTGGTLGFTITPESSLLEVDFDFFVFGPNASCGNTNLALRCSTTNPEAAGSSSNITGMNATETDLNEGPGISGNNFVRWLDVLDNETYFIVIDRPVGTSNFDLTWTGTATFITPPAFDNVTVGRTLDLEKCDSDALQDNSTDFDLTSNIPLAVGNQQHIVATFHTNPNDVLTGSSPIATPNHFLNTVNPQPIYIRLTNSISGCFSTSQFNLNVTAFQVPDPVNLRACNLNNAGFATFHLNDNNQNLINGDPELAVSYHPAKGSAIILPNNYVNSIANTNETVWVKIRNTISGCYVYKPFDLLLIPVPNPVPVQLTQCDFGLFPDGLTDFNLAQANQDLTANNPNLSTKFYATLADAQNDNGELANTFTNTINPQILGVRLIDNTTGCYGLTTLTLYVTSNPSVSVTLTRCDDDGNDDALFLFNLTDAGFESPLNTVRYYQNLNDALMEENPIAANYSNTIPNQQTVFARVENNNSCQSLNQIALLVQPLPRLKETDSAVFCLNKPNIPTILDAGLLSGNLANLQYVWSPGGAASATIPVFAAGTYSVRVTNSLGCYKDRTITVTNSDIPEIEHIAIADLLDNNTVTVTVNGDQNQFVYSIDLPNGPFQDSNYFENVAAGIHTVSISDKEGCGIVSKEISVLGIPKFFTPNGDHYHDTWNITGVNARFNLNSKIYIFDRYGKLLQEIDPEGQGWDGTFNGTTLASDDYWFAIFLEDGRIVKGHFALKR